MSIDIRTLWSYFGRVRSSAECTKQHSAVKVSWGGLCVWGLSLEGWGEGGV